MHSTYLKNGEKNGAKTLRVNHYLQAGTMQIKFYTNRCCCRRSPCGSQHSGASGWGSWIGLGRNCRKFYIIIWFCELWTSKVKFVERKGKFVRHHFLSTMISLATNGVFESLELGSLRELLLLFSDDNSIGYITSYSYQLCLRNL